MIKKILKAYIETVSSEFELIPSERKATLKTLADFITGYLKEEGLCNLIFICTHNSRRSHLSQAWAQVAACYYGMPQVSCYSGGTEATALFPMAANALAKAGFTVKALSEGKNPVYSIKYAENIHPMIGFSKTFDHNFNPESGFAAIMTCSHADANCPTIFTAAKRISLPYDDPKAFDGTPQQEEKYDERCREIAREMVYTFSKVK